MEPSPRIKSDEPLDLGRDGEAQFERLRASIEHGRGFELFICGFDNWLLLSEVKRRLASMPPQGHAFEALPLEGPNSLRTIAERLAAIRPAGAGRKLVFASCSGWEEDMKAQWAMALRRFNERRNITIRQCRNAIVLAGPSWLPWLAHDEAPDLWSVRTAVFTFADPPANRERPTPSQHEMWRSGMPMAHELELPTYYEELATALESSRRSGEQGTRGRLLLRAGAAWELQGEYAHAVAAVKRAKEAFSEDHEEFMVAVAVGRIADILVNKGETEEALTLRRGEELPVYERLGDVREQAVTMSKIADLLRQGGQTQDALRICREEVLPVFVRLGDLRNWALTMSRIADILQQTGAVQEALRICREEVLPVFVRLGDLRNQALTMSKIADILQQTGAVQEALRICREEVLPAFVRLGDVRNQAFTMARIADILQRGGDTQEALHIWRAEVLPVVQRVGDVRNRAATMVKMASILQKMGDTQEALRICRQEVLPVYERLGDVRSRAITMSQIADILRQKGDIKEALRIFQEELPVYERLGGVRERAVTMSKIADILQQRGDTQEALRIRRQEELPVYERLGDVRERAVTMSKIADILQQRGDTQEALHIWIEDCLPSARRTQDVDLIANIRFSCAKLRLARGGLEKGEAATISKELAESFALVKMLQRADGIAFVGRLFGQILAHTGSVEEAATVLDESAAAFEKLKLAEEAAEVRELQEQIRQGNE